MGLERLAGWGRAMTGVLFPGNCRRCGNPFVEGLSNILCRPCFDAIPLYADPVCGHCGTALPPGAFEGSSNLRCADCGQGGYFLDGVRAAGPYEGALRILHHGFKFEGMEGLALEIARILSKALPAEFYGGTEALVPVPQSPEKERERGYNPAALIARGISAETGVRVRPLLRKARPTPPQASLARSSRLKNPRGAYRVAPDADLPGKVLLVDDVFTTGATLEECASVLKKAGVPWVGGAVFGRTARFFGQA
jgi:ComF family protein